MFDLINQSVTQNHMVCVGMYKLGMGPVVITLNWVCLVHSGARQYLVLSNWWRSVLWHFYFRRDHSSAWDDKHEHTNTVTRTMNESVPNNSINLNNNSQWGKCVNETCGGGHYMHAGTVHKAKRPALKMQIKYGGAEGDVKELDRARIARQM